MKKIILLFALLFFNTVIPQKKMTTDKGIINFEASVPLFEEINATNETAFCTLNIKTGEIESLVLMKGFRFKIALMEKHFNENYIESDKYPKATFEGVIQGFNINLIGTAPKEFKMYGILELHGKSKKINTIAKLRKANNALEIITDFNVKTDDFDVEIPQILTKKVSKTVNVKTTFLVK